MDSFTLCYLVIAKLNWILLVNKTWYIDWFWSRTLFHPVLGPVKEISGAFARGKMPHYHQCSVGESMPGFHVNKNIVHLTQHQAGELLDCCSTLCKTSHILETADEVIVGVIVSKPFKDTHERQRTTGSSSYHMWAVMTGLQYAKYKPTQRSLSKPFIKIPAFCV